MLASGYRLRIQSNLIGKIIEFIFWVLGVVFAEAGQDIFVSLASADMSHRLLKQLRNVRMLIGSKKNLGYFAYGCEANT